MSTASVIVIVAEMFVGSDTCPGHRIIDAQQVFNSRSSGPMRRAQTGRCGGKSLRELFPM
ncbi:hypothetical protein RR42_s0037 [Cupriavidus basilensis]|uniref:Uncharacterized protein n=1 Tax=Cupriavidus basilensis TaxID=68895 RepID=A0A0C4YFZ9_9BURK|nr:hypothetical protein RR42_s0037 [Cupriavidus basilensis]